MQIGQYKKWIVSLSLIIMVGAYAGIWVWHNAALDKLRVTSLTISDQTSSLHSELGYGGLIHNFKNAVLRPDEPKYFQAVRENGFRASAYIETLEAEALKHGLELDFTETRSMIEHYSREIDRVETLSRQESTPQAIDAQVRFDDSKALEEVANAQAHLLGRIEQEVTEIDRISMALAYAGTLFLLGFIILTSRRILMEQKREDAIKLTAKNFELEKANTQLETANEALKQFAGIASHDLKAPARQMSMFADLILEDQYDPELVKDYAGQIKNASEHMRNMVESLLVFTKTAYKIPERTEIDMTAIVEHAIYVTTYGFKTEPDIQIDTLPDCRADELLMERIWENLIGNALKYQVPGNSPKIRISGKHNEIENSYDYFIEDNGIGIEPTYADMIFNPLKRLHGEKSGFEGQGIGLALVKSVIEAHNGTVWLDKAFKGGSRFCFRIPAA